MVQAVSYYRVMQVLLQSTELSLIQALIIQTTEFFIMQVASSVRRFEQAAVCVSLQSKLIIVIGRRQKNTNMNKKLCMNCKVQNTGTTLEKYDLKFTTVSTDNKYF